MRIELKSQEKEYMDAAIASQAMTRIRDAKREGASFSVYCYISFGGEADTRKLLSWLWEQQIPVAAPRVEGTRLSFSWICSMEDLEPGFHGILEPKSSCCQANDRTAVVIVPGAAFSEAGERLGYGGGFYDRFFMEEPEHERIGLAYEFQILKNLPVEAHDVIMNQVVTESRVICLGGKERKWN